MTKFIRRLIAKWLYSDPDERCDTCFRKFDEADDSECYQCGGCFSCTDCCDYSGMINQHTRSAEAFEQGICHTATECDQMYAEIDDGLKAPALAMLKTELSPALSEIKYAYRANPDGWYISNHFDWGMAVRNLLREKGFGEEYFGIHNLDDIYIALVEEALELETK